MPSAFSTEILKIPPKPAASRKRREEVALLHVTDTQIGKVTESYNVATADSRLMLLADKVRTIVEMRRTSSKVDELVLVLGGDMVEGENIFPGQQFEIEGGVFDHAVKYAPEILTRMTMRLMEFFPCAAITAGLRLARWARTTGPTGIASAMRSPSSCCSARQGVPTSVAG